MESIFETTYIVYMLKLKTAEALINACDKYTKTDTLL